MATEKTEPASQESPATATSDREVVITHVFDAPRDLVFKAWSEPERLARWWGPKGYAIEVSRLEFRPGGVFHYCMSGPAGSAMSGKVWGRFVYREIVPPGKITFVISFSDANGGITRHPLSATWPLEVFNTLTLTEQQGKTTMTLRASPINATEAERKTFEEGHTSLQQGFKGTLDQLAEYLAEGL